MDLCLPLSRTIVTTWLLRTIPPTRGGGTKQSPRVLILRKLKFPLAVPIIFLVCGARERSRRPSRVSSGPLRNTTAHPGGYQSGR